MYTDYEIVCKVRMVDGDSGVIIFVLNTLYALLDKHPCFQATSFSGSPTIFRL